MQPSLDKVADKMGHKDLLWRNYTEGPQKAPQWEPTWVNLMMDCLWRKEDKSLLLLLIITVAAAAVTPATTTTITIITCCIQEGSGRC